MAGTFAGFELKEEMGRGAAGVVYRAREVATGLEVALKVVARELAASPGFAERFQREASAARSVEHENVARLLGTGEAEGRPFLVLELVPGGSLADRIRAQGPLPWREAAARAAEIARGLEAVHAAGLVHRDVTPGNVLLDAAGRAKLADFGLVRLVGARLPGEVGSLTRTGEIVGTLEFLSPEQANGTGEVDARADLYGLGATLHALVTGSPPFQGDSYALVKQHLLARPPGLRTLVPDVPLELEALVQRLLEKDPALRGDMGSVALELEAIAAGEELSGSGTTRRGLLAGALALAAGGVGLGAGAFLRSRLRPAPVRSPSPSPSPAPSPPGLDLAALEARLANDPEVAETVQHWKARRARLVAIWGRAAWKAPNSSLGVAVSSDGTWALTGEEDWFVRRWDLATGHLLGAHYRRGWPIALAISGNRIASAGDQRDMAIELVDLSSQKTSRIEVPSVASGLAFSPDGKRLLTGHLDGTLRLRDFETESEPLAIAAHRPGRVTVAFAADGHRALSAGEDGTVKLWELGTAEEIQTLAVGSPVASIAPSPREPDKVLVGSRDGQVSLWSLTTAQPLWSEHLHVRGTSCVAFSPDGLVAASGGDGGQVVILDRGSHIRGAIPAHRACVTRIAFTADSKRVVTSSLDQTLGLFDVADGRDVRTVSGHRGSVSALAVVPSGERVLSGGSDGAVRLWDASGREHPQVLEHGSRVVSIAVTPDGRRALTGTLDGKVRLWDLAQGQLLETVATAAEPAGNNSSARLALSPDGRRAISAEGKGAIAAWRLEPFERRELRAPGKSASAATSAGFLRDGQALVGGMGGELLLFELELGTSRTLAPAEGTDPEAAITSLAVLPGGKGVLLGTAGGTVRLWDLELGRPIRTFDPGTTSNRVETMALAPDGKTFAATYYDRNVRHWDIASSSELDRIEVERLWDGALSVAWLDARSLLVGMLRGELLRFAV